MKLHALVVAAVLAIGLAASSQAQTLRWAAQNDILTLDPVSYTHLTLPTSDLV